MDKEKVTALGKNKRHFNIEVSILETYFGRRFMGRLRITEKEIAPYLFIERAAPGKVRSVWRNVLSPEDFLKMGYEVLFPEVSGFWKMWGKWIPAWLDWIVSGIAKRAMMREYQKICVRHKMLFVTFFGQQDGRMVSAIDVREMTDEEYGFFTKRKEPVGTSVR